MAISLVLCGGYGGEGDDVSHPGLHSFSPWFR